MYSHNNNEIYMCSMVQRNFSCILKMCNEISIEDNEESIVQGKIFRFIDFTHSRKYRVYVCTFFIAKVDEN